MIFAAGKTLIRVKTMSFSFHGGETKKVFVGDNEPESLKLAVNDLIKDINSVCGKAESTSSFLAADIICCSDKNEMFAEISNGVSFAREEELFYEIKNDKIVICGNGDLGTMWGIYTFSEKELGIPPYYLFDDFKPIRKEKLELAEKTVSDYPKTRFRGWFINDEDLLDGFMSQGKRDLDYAFYQNVIHPDLMEMIVETALRYRMNLLIPSSLTDIYNPPEENLVKIIEKRGLFVSQHHIEPLGAFANGMKKFFKNNGYSENISYISNKEGMIACWKHYAEGWAKYPRVVWQLGLRGMADKPVWQSDSSVGQSDEARGALISEAIKTQYDIIAEASGTDEIYATSTVWMEGAHLLSAGTLDLPQKTITVFADIGMSQMFGNDFFNVKRLAGRKYGVYYHSAYWHTGPHLSEGVLPQKMQFSYELARKYNSDYYSVLNVGNIKEFTFSIYLNSKIVWSGGEITAEKAKDNYARAYVGDMAEEMKSAIDLYYKGLGHIPDGEYEKFCKKYNFDYHDYGNTGFPSVNLNDGIMYWCFHNEFNYKKDFYTKEFGETVRSGLAAMTKANETFEKIAESLPNDKKLALQRQWGYQSYLWVCFFSAAKLVCELIERSESMTKEDFISTHEKVAEWFLRILEKRKECYTGKWQGWFNGDGKVSVKRLYEACLTEISHADDYCPRR